MEDQDTPPTPKNVFDPGNTVPNTREYHNEETLFKVKEAIKQVGASDSIAEEIIGSVLNAGIVFRQRGIE